MIHGKHAGLRKHSRLCRPMIWNSRPLLNASLQAAKKILSSVFYPGMEQKALRKGSMTMFKKEAVIFRN